MSTPSVLLQTDGLAVHAGGSTLLAPLSLQLRAGEVLTLLGESGAGKSLLAQAIMGNLPASLGAQGTVTTAGKCSAAADGHQRRPLWGRHLALLPQEPAQALSPLMRVLPQVAEVRRLVCAQAPNLATTQARQSLSDCGLLADSCRYPWQLSGGMAQRAAMAAARAAGGAILLADEPTKGLDSHWRDQVVAQLRAVQDAGGCVLLITHDLRVARAMGGRLMVLRQGHVVEQGETEVVLSQPQHAFTRELLAADPSQWARRPPPNGLHAQHANSAVLQAQGLAKQVAGRLLFQHLDMHIRRGDRWVIQGHSGAGKTTLGDVLLGLTAVDGGRLERAPGLPATAFQKLYQDPVSSFAAQASLSQSLRDAARLHQQSWTKVLQRLQRLGIDESLLARRPAQVSGGELQRIALARSLLARPALLVADEPTSRLDPVSQHGAMQLLLEVAQEEDAALVLITHDDDMAQAVGDQFVRLQ